MCLSGTEPWPRMGEPAQATATPSKAATGTVSTEQPLFVPGKRPSQSVTVSDPGLRDQPSQAVTVTGPGLCTPSPQTAVVSELRLSGQRSQSVAVAGLGMSKQPSQSVTLSEAGLSKQPSKFATLHESGLNKQIYYMHNEEIRRFLNKLKAIITSGLGGFISSKEIFLPNQFYFSYANILC